MNVFELLDLLKELNRHVVGVCEIVVHKFDRCGGRLWVSPTFEVSQVSDDFVPYVVIQDYDEQRVEIPLHLVTTVVEALQTVAADPRWQAALAEAQAKIGAAK